MKFENKLKEIGIGKIIKKNQVVILTLALMLMTAGYMNYTNNQENENTLLAQLGDAQLVSTNIIENEQTNNEVINEEENQIEEKEDENQIEEINNTSENEITESSNIADNTIQETSSNIKDDYFTKSKLERDSMYSQMLETYKGILENEKIASEQKGIAENEIKNINDKKSAIMIVENLLQTKGFANSVVFINDPSINVIIKGKELAAEQVAQIQNIVQRELKTEIENVHITTKE